MTVQALSAEFLLELFEYKEGKLYWKINPKNNNLLGTRAGCTSTKEGYRSIKINSKRYLEHRIVWCMFKGAWPSDDMEIDHINRNTADNRIENLRLVTRSCNSKNRVGKGYSKTTNGKYQARIIVNKKFINLGTFATEKEAAEKYLEAKRHYHPEFFEDRFSLGK